MWCCTLIKYFPVRIRTSSPFGKYQVAGWFYTSTRQLESELSSYEGRNMWNAANQPVAVRTTVVGLNGSTHTSFISAVLARGCCQFSARPAQCQLSNRVGPSIFVLHVIRIDFERVHWAKCFCAVIELTSHSQISQPYSTCTCTFSFQLFIHAILLYWYDATVIQRQCCRLHAEQLHDDLHYLIYSIFFLYSHLHRCPTGTLDQAAISQTDVMLLQCDYRITSVRDAVYKYVCASHSFFQHSQFSISKVRILFSTRYQF